MDLALNLVRFDLLGVRCPCFKSARKLIVEFLWWWVKEWIGTRYGAEEDEGYRYPYSTDELQYSPAT